METPNILKHQIGLGTFPFSNVFSTVTQDDARNIIETFLSQGGRYVETAPSYPVNRVHLAPILSQYNRDAFEIGTKCVVGVDEDGQRNVSGKPAFIRKQCEDELRRLSLDYLDLFQAHLPPKDVHPGITMEAMEQLRSEQKVRYLGVSNVTLRTLQEFQECGHVDFIQNRYSIIHRSETEPLVDFCRKNQIYLNPFQIIERGQLTDAVLSSTNWAPMDLRRKKPEFQGDAYSFISQWIRDCLKPIADQNRLPLEALSIGWVLAQPQVSIAVLGATSVAQVTRNLAQARAALNPEVIEKINSAYRFLKSTLATKGFQSVEEFRGISLQS